MKEIYCHECKKVVENPKFARINRLPFCTILCKAKSCITLLENGCWKPRIMAFTLNSRSHSVRAVLYEKAFGTKLIVRNLSPSCGFKTCANPFHINFRHSGRSILFEEL
jgi:hypothetical protein